VTRSGHWASEPAEEASAGPALEAFARVMSTLLASASAGASARQARPVPMLSVQQTAVLLGLSRMTVIRKADAGELPCVVVSRGMRQKMRRFPRAAIEELAASGGGAGVELAEYTARWIAAHAEGQDAQTGDRAAG